MSPLLGSAGGSSEYAFRGTLDDWPVDFAAALAAQNPASPIDPVTSVTATLTITGLNYKARLIAEHPNVTVRVTSEFGVAVTDGREVYAARKASDPPLLIRDQSVVDIRLQPTSGTIADFLKTYTIPVTIGKRQGVWTVSTRAIDETPTSFIFNSLIDQELGITTTTSTAPPLTIAGLENGFAFPISVTADQVGGNVSYFKNGVEFTTSSTVVNGDQIYLSTLTPSTYSTPRTFTVKVGTFTTSWGILTRNAVTTINPFSFTGISSANQLGFGYTSGFMTVSGADTGPKFPLDPTTWPTDPTAILVTRTGIGSFQILKSDNTLRYTDPANPAAPNYWQFGPTYAFNGDKINLKVPSSLSYNTTTSTTLNVSDKSGTFNVTTRPAPIDTVPQDLNNAFTDLTGQARGSTIQSNTITLSGMSPATATGTASILGDAGITPQFNVNGSATWISPPTTAAVKNGDTIRLRMTTTNPDINSGFTNNNITLTVNGVDTSGNIATPIDNPEGFTTNSISQTDTWNVQTTSRNCTIIPPTNTDNTYGLGTVTGVATNTSVSTNITFPSPNWENECRMTVSTDRGVFTRRGVGGGTVVNSATLSNVLPTETLTLTVTSSSSFDTPITVGIGISNVADPTISPKDTDSVTWTVRTAPDNTPADVTLGISPTSVEVGGPFTLTWGTTNSTSIRSVAGPGWTVVPTSLSGSVNLNAPTTANVSPGYAYTITAYANPSASNAIPGFPTTPGALPSDPPIIPGGPRRYYDTATVSLSVTEDTSPVFTDTVDPAIVDFTTQLDVAPSTLLSPKTYLSNSLRVSNISVKLTARIDDNPGQSDPGANMSINGGPLTKNSIANIGVGTNIQLSALAAEITGTSPVGYDTPSKAVVRFYYGTPEVEVANKTFTIRTQVCVANENTVQFPSTVGALNYVTLPYYVGYKWQNINGTASATGSLLKGRIVTSVGNASAYYRSVLAPVAGFDVARFSGSQTVDIGWQELIDAIWNAHIQELQRPPTQSYIENVLINFIPYSPAVYTDMATFITAYLRPLAAGSTGPGSPPNNSPIRNTAIDIVDVPCERIIKTGAYSLVGGFYV